MLDLTAMKNGTVEEVNAAIQSAVDELGRLKAKEDDIANRRQAIKEALANILGDQKQAEFSGKLFRAVLSTRSAAYTNWKAVAEACKPTTELIAQHTSSKPQLTLTVRAR